MVANSGSNQQQFLTDDLHIFVLCSFAMAQPLFDLLGRTPEFFVVRHSEPVDLFLLVVALCILFPGLIVFAEVAAGWLGQRVRKWVHGIAVACLAAAFALQALKRVGAVPGVALMAGAAFLGLGLAIGCLRLPSFRSYLTMLSPAVLIFPGLFLFHSSVSKVVFPKQQPEVALPKINATAPIIMVIFDAFPVTSLMDEYRQIDSIRYPNFSALAQDATWFRNATAVEDFSVRAVPAILSGNYPDPARLPIWADHPQNILTLLSRSYRLKVYGSITELCPNGYCEKEQNSVAERMIFLMSDLSIVYLHLLLPEDMSGGLPPITQNWLGFAGGVTAPKNNEKATNFRDRIRSLVRQDRSRQFMELVNALGQTNRPTLYCAHVLLPHGPFVYLPSGKTYSIGLGTWTRGLLPGKRKWSSDEFAVVRDYQRHLLQVGFVDTLLGKLLTRLKALGLYERSLIVVTSDHGVSFRLGDYRRELSKTNFQDIGSVPLFIKAPNQRKGTVNDRNVETIDILPTMADILGIDIPWHTDGRSAFDPSVPERKTKIIYSKGIKYRMALDAALEGQNATLKRKLALFGSGVDSDRILKIGPHSELVGRRIDDVGVMGEASVKGGLDRGVLFTDVDPESDFVPTFITGYVRENPPTSTRLDLAIAINGTIRATTRTYTFPIPEGLKVWEAMADEASFRAGHNDVEIFVISSRRGKPILLRSYAMTAPRTYLNVPLGTRWIKGVTESGFYFPARGGKKRVRWTKGKAELVVPIEESSPPQAVQVDLAFTGPHGTRLAVLVDRYEVFNEFIPPGRWSKTFDLSGHSFKDRVTIVILSDTFVPRETMKGSSDRRTLGVLVKGITLLDSDHHKSSEEDPSAQRTEHETHP